MNALFGAAAAFFLLHLYPSTPLRRRSIALVGEGPYSAIFSLVSLAAIWWLVRSFAAAPYGEKLWVLPDWWSWAMAALVLFAFILVVAGGSAPNPSAVGADRVLDRPDVGNGIFAVTRHPLMWGIAIWAACHLISQATVRGIAFFGAFIATALLGAWLQEQRKRAALSAWAAFETRTSFIPFAALMEGRAHLSLKALGWWRIGIAVLLWAAMLYFHASLFGVPPLAPAS